MVGGIRTPDPLPSNSGTWPHGDFSVQSNLESLPATIAGIEASRGTVSKAARSKLDFKPVFLRLLIHVDNPGHG